MPHLALLAPLCLLLALAAPTAATARSVKVGQTNGPHESIMEVVRAVAKERGLQIDLVSFSDFIMPNSALDDRSIDANSYQTRAFLDAQIQARGYKLVSVGKTVLFPMGLYSQRHKALEQLPDRATIAIPNDPANADRSLRLIERIGLIKLDPRARGPVTDNDIAENPRNFSFVLLEAGQLPRSLQDVDLAAINTSYAIKAGLNPSRDSLAREDLTSPHTNLLVVRKEDKDQPWVRELVAAYHSEPVRRFILKEFDGAAVPSF